MAERKYQTPEILHDAPLDNDKKADFKFDDFAATFARLIAYKDTETPLTIGVNGAWGSGKTSLLLRVKNMLDEPKRSSGGNRFAEEDEGGNFRTCKTIWFDAWKYSGEDQILAALLRAIVAEMQMDGFWNRLKSDLKVKKEELRWFDMLADSLIQFASAGVYSLDLDDYRVETPLKQASAFFDYFDDSLAKLLSAWTGEDGRLVIFIDDLDRCMSDKAVQVLEAIKLFLDKSGCVFVIGADTGTVQKAVESYYQNEDITGEKARDYLEKVIQLRFDLPPIVETAMQDYLKMQDKDKVDDAMFKRWRALIAAAEVNPRRVKNVINDLNLQWFMALNSGQVRGINRDDFICWKALMRAASNAFAVTVAEFEDKNVRYNFVMDALKWQNGEQDEKEAVQGFFTDYEDKDSKRLRAVLKQISFSDEFTPDTLHAMITLTAPPQKGKTEKPPVEKAVEAEGKESLEIAVSDELLVDDKAPAVVRRAEGSVKRSERNRRTIGGLDFVRIPAGAFVMGSKEDNELSHDDERPQHTLNIEYDYWMGMFILTNRQFAEFVKDSKHETTAEKEGGWHPEELKFVKGVDWKHPTDQKDKWEEKEDHPVVQVSWDDAMKYCKWFNETFKSDLGDLLLRLPTEAEWEKAARGAYGNDWPWGNEFDPKKCNSREGKRGGTTSVGLYSTAGDSPYGCADMVGNVWEWTHTLFEKYPYDAKDGREDASSPDSRVLRGGSFYANRSLARCAYRYANSPGFRNDYVGFRVCLSSPSHI
ncbi:MAG TPA: SUMF1/EgtB/PvdO family nonheme iron enzyme [Anaerolineales bacterium]|nr:SUMF1/EgtB/PvdO family nonheme iron enzyme [Anaerolineales bacterium]